MFSFFIIIIIIHKCSPVIWILTFTSKTKRSKHVYSLLHFFVTQTLR